MKRLVGYTAVIVATGFSAFLVFQFRQVLLIFVMSLLLAAAVRPIYQRLVDGGVGSRMALPLIYLGLLLLLAGLFIIVGRLLINDLQSMASDAATGYEAAYIEWSEGSQFQELLTNWLPAPDIVLRAAAGTERGGLVGRLASVTGGLLGAAGIAAAVFIISVYWTADSTRFERISLALLPANRRAGARAVWRTIEKDLGAYVRSEALQSGAAGVLLGLGYWFLGMPYTVMLAMLGALAWLIPLAGPVFVIAPVILVGISSGRPLVAVAAALHALVVLMLLEYVIEPRLFNRRQYSPMLSLILMLMLIQEFGLPGLVVGPPLAAALQRLFAQLLFKRSRHAAKSKLVGDQLIELKQRLAQATETIDISSGDGPGASEPSQKYSNLANRLNDLIQQVEEAFAGELATHP